MRLKTNNLKGDYPICTSTSFEISIRALMMLIHTNTIQYARRVRMPLILSCELFIDKLIIVLILGDEIQAPCLTDPKL